MKTKILVVDDEPNILMSLEFLLRKKGYEVFIARDGEEALNLFNSQEPNMAILDIMMPKVDGYEVCNHIKATLPSCKVIFLSAKTKEADIAKGYATGADLYMTKPFSTKKLLNNIEQLKI